MVDDEPATARSDTLSGGESGLGAGQGGEPPVAESSDVGPATAGDGAAPSEEASGVRGFCHGCSAVRLTRVNEESGELECTSCSGCFIEVNPEDDDRGLSAFLDRPAAEASGSGGTPGEPPPDLVAGAIQQILAQVLGGQAQGGGGGGDGAQADGQPSVEMLGALQPLFATSVSGGQGGGGASALFGDYAVGNLSNIIEQLMAQDGATRAKPASREAVKRLCTVVHCGEKEVSDGWECAIHKEPFALGEAAMRLPCGHLFLEEAIMTWLKNQRKR